MQILLPIIMATASAAGGALISRALSPKMPSAAPYTPEKVPTAAENARAEADSRAYRAGIARRELPGLQERLGGSVSPDYQATMAALLSGNADIVDWFRLSNSGTGSSGLMGAGPTSGASPSFSSIIQPSSITNAPRQQMQNDALEGGAPEGGMSGFDSLLGGGGGLDFMKLMLGGV